MESERYHIHEFRTATHQQRFVVFDNTTDRMVTGADGFVVIFGRRTDVETFVGVLLQAVAS